MPHPKGSTRKVGRESPMMAKMDLPLRRLAAMTDRQILEGLNRFGKLVDSEKTKARIPEKLPPRTKPEERAAVKRALRELHSRLQPPSHLVPVQLDRFRRIRVRAIVHFTGNRKDLEGMGIQVRSQAQDIFTIFATPSQLAALAAKPACRLLRSPRILYPTVEQASAQNEVAPVHNPRPLNPTGFRGNNVIVAIIDSPLDVTHHGFRDPAGTHASRVLYYWVQGPDIANPPGVTPDQFTAGAAAGTRPNFAGLTYGRLYTQADINAALGLAQPFGNGANQICCEPDSVDPEHGTHCVGIAAGSGHVNNWSTAPVHVGAAPNATIIYVSRPALPTTMNRDGFSEDTMMDALNFCIEAARFHNMPIALSVSQGNNLGPHNGMDVFDLQRDNLLNSFDDRAIVFAAGNDNNVTGYRRGTVGANTTDQFTLTSRRNGVIYLDVWYDGPELDIRVAFAANDTGWVNAGQDFSGNVGTRFIEIERDADGPNIGLRNIRIRVGNALNLENYAVDLRNPSTTQNSDYRAWTASQGWWASVSGSTQNEGTLADTGCSRSILTVGACGKVLPPNPATGETIAGYSGAGPTYDGRIKPEIVAVGGTLANPINSANSNQASGYTTMFGTSMATPLAAGAIALLFEEYGALGIHLNQDTVKALLIRHADRTALNIDPAQPGYVAEDRNRYGYGRLRLIGPIDEIMPPVSVDLWIRTADDDYGHEPYLGGCFCHAPDIRVFQAGTNTETTTINWGSVYDVRITVRNMGDSPAVGATVRLKYALPHAAPSAWFEAEDAANQKLNQTVQVPAMGQQEVLFQWRPEQGELGAPADQHHFCLLAEVDHAADPLMYAAPTMSGGTAWTANIKGTNNIALRNLNIQ